MKNQNYLTGSFCLNSTISKLFSRSLNAGLFAFLLLCGLDLAQAQYTLVLSNKWSLAPGSRYYLPTSVGNPRSFAINRMTGNVLIPSVQGGSNHVVVVSGVDGTELGSLATNNITGTGFVALLGVGVADDGVVYACNGENASSNFKVYRWSAEDITGTLQPTVAFGGDAGAIPGPVNTRCGDSFFVRGAGTNTQLIASGTGSGYFTIFTTTDGTNFSASQIAIPSTPGAGGFARTVAFDGTNNAFWGGRENSAKLYYVTFDLGSLAATTVSNITISPAMGMCAVRSTNSVGILAGIYDTGTIGSSSRSLLVYDMGNLGGTAFGGNVAFPAGGSADGNITGQADIGAGMVAALSTQGGIVALSTYLQASAPATITTPPVGIAGVYPVYTLTVGASGSLPLRFQWLASSDGTGTAATFTNIPGATSNSYSVNVATTNYFEVIVTNAYGGQTSSPVLVSLLAPVNSTVVTQLWRVAAGANGYSYLSPTDNSTRGIGYDTNLNRVVVTGTSGGTAIHILDGNNGTNIGTMDLSAANLGGGTFQIDQVAVADDGAVYSGNLALPGQSFVLNRWPAATTTAIAFNSYADAGLLGFSGDRWGDNMTGRGSGTGTQILLSSRNGTNVALLTTVDGLAFTATVVAITNVPPGFGAQGIAFGAGNTLWAKAYQGHLYQIAFDPGTQTGGKIGDFANPGQTPGTLIGVGLDPVRNILAGVDVGDVPNDVKLFQVPPTGDPPVLFHQAFFASANANGNQNAALAMSYPRLYALDVNNGIVALTYGVPPTTPPLITVPPADLTVYTNAPEVILAVNASGSVPLYYQWRYYGPSTNNLPANIPGATNSTYVLNYPPKSASGYYDVVVHNVAGYATSAPPTLLTVTLPASSIIVTQLWTLAAGSRSYLDASTYNTRGLAYDTNTGTVLVCDHQNIYVLAGTNGADLFQLNTLGLPVGGLNGWALDQIAVADDGVVYGANLSLDGSGFAVTSWSAVSSGAALNSAWGGSTGADPTGGTGDRVGDTMDVRGSGVNTEILLGTYSGTHVVLFTTSDGINFTANSIAITNVPAGFSGQGIAFGPGNTFWAKSPGFLLRQVAFDRVNSQGGAVQSYTAMPAPFDGISVDVAAGILGGVNFNNTPNDFELYLLSGNATPPSLFDQTFFGSVNINSQLNAASRLKAGFGVALDVNNGLVALNYGVPAAPAVTIISVNKGAAGTALTWNNCFNGHSYQVQFKDALTDPTWNNVGPAIPANGPTASYTDFTAAGTARFYRVSTQ